MNRKREQADLIFKIGQFFGPLLRVADAPDSFGSDERMRIEARFTKDFAPINQMIRDFTLGETGADYEAQWLAATRDVGWLIQGRGIGPAGRDWYEAMQRASRSMLDAIHSIPIPIDSAIYEGNTPFSTYCFVKDLCSTVREHVIWLDRFFDQTLFHRFFVETPYTVQVTLVTWPATLLISKSDRQRHADFMDVSRLFAKERGPRGYRLIENGQFHDRSLRCDDRMFALGGSIKDLSLAKDFTISCLDTTPENSSRFDDAVATGTELFGESHPAHP